MGVDLGQGVVFRETQECEARPSERRDQSAPNDA